MELVDDKKIITLDKVQDNHIIVAVINNKPCILGKGYNQPFKDFAFFIISSNESANITTGNSYKADNTIQGTCEEVLRDFLSQHLNSTNRKVAVFNQDDWKEALSWLINNC